MRIPEGRLEVRFDSFGTLYIEGTQDYKECLQRGTGREGDPQWVQSWYRALDPNGEEITISFAEYPDGVLEYEPYEVQRLRSLQEES